MKPARLALFALIIGSCLSAPLAQSTKPPNDSRLTLGAITGRVISRGKGLGGAVVTLWRQPANVPQPGALSTKSDADGNYRIVDVSPGNYYVSVDAPGFVTFEDGRPSEQSRSISLASGETLSGIDFALVPGGIVTGTVTDNTGNPVGKEQVRLIQAEPKPSPEPSATFYRGALTDDRGNYRVTDVPAGRYKIAAGPPFAAFATVRGRPAHLPAFYPGVTDESKARVIELKEGAEVSNIDVNVGAAVRVFAVSGRIVDSKTGQPLPNTDYALSILSGSRQVGGISQDLTSNSAGEFKIENLLAGHYSIMVPPSVRRVGAPSPKFLGESAPFDVIDQDVSGIEVRVVEGATVSGFVVLEGTTDKAVIARQLQRRLAISSLPKSPGRLSHGITPIGADGSFAVSGLGPGTLGFQFIQADTAEPTLFRLGRFERDGVELPLNIEIKAGEQITGLRILLVYAIGSVRGQVKFEDGSLPPNTRLGARLLADNPGDSALLPGAFVDSRGYFLLENVPAGRYKLVVHNWTSGVPIKAQQEVLVTEGGVTDVTVVIDPKPTPVP